MLLIIDNYDSFVHNIVRYCAELGHIGRVIRNDALDIDAVEAFSPRMILISPGPGNPEQAGISLPLVRRFSSCVPILGVCLGLQCIGAAFGGGVVRARQPMHGRTSDIAHDGTGLFTGLPSPLSVGRYHSLVVSETPALHRHVAVTARSAEGEVMALAHRTHPTFGVQFHPESVLSQHGHAIFSNFFRMARDWRADAVA